MKVPSSACDPGLMKSMYLLVSANLQGNGVTIEKRTVQSCFPWSQITVHTILKFLEPLELSLTTEEMF